MARLTSTLNHAGQILAECGHLGNTEIVVSDWGSEEPLSGVLDLNAEPRKIVHFNYIPREATAKLPTEFSEVHALNSAARLIAGDFIGRIDQDTLIGRRFVEWFFGGGFSTRCAYFSSRRDMAEGQPAERYEEAPLWKEDRRAWHRSWFWRAAVGIFLIPRQTYWDLGGYDEANIHRGHMEQEFVFRLRRAGKVLCPNGESWGLLGAAREPRRQGTEKPSSAEI